VGGVSSGDCAPERNSKADSFTDTYAYALAIFYLDSHAFARTDLDFLSASYCSVNSHSYVDPLANAGFYSHTTDPDTRRSSGSSSIRQSRY
jgi:hypothetical protein